MHFRQIFFKLLLLFAVGAPYIVFAPSVLAAAATSSPNVQTGQVGSIYSNSATFQGTLYSFGGGGTVSVWFEWGTDTTYQNKTTPKTLSYTGPFSQTISQLDYKTVYHFRAVAENSYGISYGQDIVFISGSSTSLAPIALAGPTQDTGLGEPVVLQGSGYDPYGGSVTFFWKCNGGTLSDPTLAEPSFTPPAINLNSGSNSENSYHYYSCTLTVTNSTGHTATSSTSVVVNGSVLSVQTGPPTDIFSNQATLTGQAYVNFSNISYVWFQWGTTASYGNETVHHVQEESGLVTQNIAGLAANTTYHYRMAGQDIYGNFTYGKDVTFISSATPPPPSSPGSQSTYIFTRYLGYGDSGNDVLMLQNLLATRGFFLATPTGYYGSVTQAAVRKLQAANGLDQTGNVGPLTKNLLNQLSASSSSGSQAASTTQQQISQIEQEIQQLQAELANQ